MFKHYSPGRIKV